MWHYVILMNKLTFHWTHRVSTMDHNHIDKLQLQPFEGSFYRFINIFTRQAFLLAPANKDNDKKESVRWISWISPEFFPQTIIYILGVRVHCTQRLYAFIYSDTFLCAKWCPFIWTNATNLSFLLPQSFLQLKFYCLQLPRASESWKYMTVLYYMWQCWIHFCFI